jgi:hypothetical protein
MSDIILERNLSPDSEEPFPCRRFRRFYPSGKRWGYKPKLADDDLKRREVKIAGQKALKISSLPDFIF